MNALQDSTLLCAGTAVLSDVPAGLSVTPWGPGVLVSAPVSAGAAVVLGRPCARVYTACYRFEPFWMRPLVTTDARAIPAETQVLFAEVEGRVALFVPLATATARCALEGGPLGDLVLVSEPPSDGPALFVALQPAGESLPAFLARCARAVGGLLRTPLRQERRLPRFADFLGWCTWDAFYHDVSPALIRAGLESFRDAGIPVRWMIIDDGWQTPAEGDPARGQRLGSFAPNQKFGGSLADLTQSAHEEFGLHTVLAWHALQGYWAGVDPTAFAAYEPRETERCYSPPLRAIYPQGTLYWGTHADVMPARHARQFFHDYHAHLAAQGVDGVKVDNQAASEALPDVSGMPRAELSRSLRAALEDSVNTHFPGNLLHCMSCSNDLLYAPGTTALTRTSGDFDPRQPSAHGMHVWANALVSLWFSHFVHPDWDMFQSHLDGPWSAFHAAARALSGGPVYLSDVPGQQDAALIRKLALSDGSVPRFPGPAAPARACLFADPTRDPVILKLINACEFGHMIGLFNCGADPGVPPIPGAVALADVPDLSPGPCVVYLHQRKVHYLLEAGGESPAVMLAAGEFELATVVPVSQGCAVIGLLEKFQGLGTIARVAHDGATVHVEMRDIGTVGIYCASRPVRVTQTGAPGRTLPLAFEWDSGWLKIEMRTGCRSFAIHFS